MDKLQAMEVFVQVVDAGGFTRAADNMQLPKATVSTLVRNLEAALAVKLLNRTTRQISLTADGAAYYERCLSILAEVRDAEDSLSKTRASPSGRLRVDVPTNLGRYLVIPALPEFFVRYPDIYIELGCSDRPVDLIEEGVDCALRGGELADSTLIARRVGALEFITCAAPSYLERHGHPQHPNDLLQHQCVNYFSAKTGKVFDWHYAKEGERIRIRAPGRIAVNDADSYVVASLKGMGIVQMSSYTALPYLASGQLVPVLQDWCTGPVPLHVVYPQNRHLSAKVRVFVEWIAELVAEQPTLQMMTSSCSLPPESAEQLAPPRRLMEIENGEAPVPRAKRGRSSLRS
ncbi:MAG TPA: LysR family transcriptional regulator [Noviherbaspirillum sp.]|nr:LysR family transcriptional regulator [Noviherbaspirillum sp.]